MRGWGKNDYIEASHSLVVVTAPGPGSGKMATCLSQLYHDPVSYTHLDVYKRQVQADSAQIPHDAGEKTTRPGRGGSRSWPSRSPDLSLIHI